MSKEKEEKKEEDKEEKKEKQSFWTTLPGIITAISGLVIAITGLVTALGDYGLFAKNGGPTPTAFPSATSVDTDVILPTPIQATPEPTDAVAKAPTCRNYIEYEGKSNPNAILLAYTGTNLWVRYGDIEEEIENEDGVNIYIFDTSDTGGDCLRQWVKYLAADHEASWPPSSTGKGRTYNEVWMNSPTPPIVGDLANWSVLPDLILITTVDHNSNPNFAQVYMCGEDVPREVLSSVAYWHAATSEEAFQGHLEQYESNRYEIRETANCSQ
jgi:hypothetical protein